LSSPTDPGESRGEIGDGTQPSTPSILPDSTQG